MRRSKPTYEYTGGGEWIDPALEYRRLFRADHYGVPKPGGVNLNKASIPRVIDEVQTEIQEQIEKWNRDGISDDEKKRIEDEARAKAAKLLGSQNPEEIIFARNTTEAISLAYWLAGQYQHEHLAAEVLMTDSENPSVYRATHVSVDNGNRDRDDLLTTYSTLVDPKSSTYPAPNEWIRHSSLNICIIGSFGDQTLQEMKNNVEVFMSDIFDDGYGKEPGLMVISHVLRHNGRVMPVKELTEHARNVKKHHYPQNPDLFVCVDGAMALGNLDKVDIDDLGCDFYAISPHKTLGSPSLGVARMNLKSPLVQEHLPIMRQLTIHDQLLFGRMFDEKLKIPSNVGQEIDSATLFGFSRTLDYLEENGIKEGNDFSKTAHKRMRVKKYAEQKLTSLKDLGVPITFLPSQEGSPFILSFNLFGCDPFEPAYIPGFIKQDAFEFNSIEKKIAQELDERGIALSFIRRGKIFRISFDWNTSEKDIDEFVRVLKEIIQTWRNGGDGA